MTETPVETTPQREMTSEELLNEVELINNYPRMAVERAIAEERERMRQAWRNCPASNNGWRFLRIINGGTGR